METNTKEMKIKVLLLSILLTGFVVALYLLDKEIVWDLITILSCIIICIYVFFLIPTIVYILTWFSTLSVSDSFKAGYKIGYYGIGLIILIDPIVGMMYYLGKKFTNNGPRGNIIMVGWYIDEIEY